MSLSDYSQTPASNDLANYFQTGMRPSSVKNAGWDIMADIAVVMGPGSLPTATGTANAQVITNTRQYGAWFTGMWVCWMPQATNTAAMTIAPDGLAAKNVFCNGAAALAGQVVLGVPAIGRYDGTQVQLINPQRFTGSFTATSTGITGNPTATVTYRCDASATLCTLIFGTGITGLGSLTTFTLTGMPALLTPLQTQAYYTSAEDATATTAATIIFTASSTTITLGKGSALGAGTSGWTASGTKGFSNGALPGQNIAVTFVLN